MPKKANKSPSTTGKEGKPKRPLSGYNLFYRFKRNAILEANATTNHQYPPLSEEDERIQIDQILKATPGLEGIPSNHVVFTYTPTALQDFRSQQIRSSMEGKLFPNENARNRLHRKVHGMGFVEMGKIMRDMWAGIDGFTKDIFCELADVGRVRYRTLLAEYKKLQGEGDSAADGGASPSTTGKGVKKAKQAGSGAEKKVGSASRAEKVKANKPSRAKVVEQVKRMYNPKASSTLPSSSSSGAHASSSATVDMIDDPIIVETPKVEVKPSVSMSFITPVPSQANLARFGTRSNNTNVSSSNVHPSMFQETGTSFSVPTMPTRHSAALQEPRYGRRVSTASELSVNSSSLTSALGMVNSTTGSITPSFTELNSSMTNSSLTRAAYQEVNMFRSLLLQNAMLPLPLYHPQMMNNTTTNMAPSSTSIINDEYTMSSFPPEIISSSSSNCNAAEKEEIPPQDFLDFIGKLDDAIDTNESSHGSSSNDTMMCNHAVKRPSMIFGKPIHDVNVSAYPLPSDYELNNARARMA